MEKERGELWTTAELAEESGLSDARIRQLLIEGRDLCGRKRGNVWLVEDAEARRWLEARKQGAR